MTIKITYLTILPSKLIFRKHQPPTLIVWSKNDYIFPADGAHPYKRDLKNLDFNLLDTGHFALEEDGRLIADKIRSFLSEQVVILATLRPLPVLREHR